VISDLTADDEVYSRLAKNIGEQQKKMAVKTLQRLMVNCDHKSLDNIDILLPFGGGKDSAWTLAYVRLMQLLLKQDRGFSFRLHILIMIHPGVPAGVFDNIKNVFSALSIYDSDNIEVITAVRGGHYVKLDKNSISESLVRLFKEEILISGHLSRGNGRETFCNGCNLGLMNVIAKYVIEKESAIDFVITGDSGSEVLGYWRWVQRIGKKFGLGTINKNEASWGSLFNKLGDINDAYYHDLSGLDSQNNSYYSFSNLSSSGVQLPQYFSVFEETDYNYDSHQHFMENFLGFSLRDDAFNFTESDCQNPMLMAHLRGLLADFEGRGYIAGVKEYLKLVTFLMEKKSYSEAMVEKALLPYQTDIGILERKAQSIEFAKQNFSITSIQLKTLVASPFADNMKRMEDYLNWCFPDNSSVQEEFKKEVEQLKEEEGNIELDLINRASGLSINNLKRLLKRATIISENNSGTPDALNILRQYDPHKMVISDPDIQTNRLITGR